MLAPKQNQSQIWTRKNMDFVYKSVSEFVGVDVSSEMSLEGFEDSLRSMIESTTKASVQSDSSEEFQKNLIANFLHKHFDYECNVFGKVDLVIYDEGIAKVLFEVKSTQNKAEFVKTPQITCHIERSEISQKQNRDTSGIALKLTNTNAWSLESKAFYESILYFLREVKREKNNNIKHIILCTAHEFYVIKAKDYHALFITNPNKAIQKAIDTAYSNCDFKQGNDTSTRKFYTEIESIVREMSDTLEFTYINIKSLLDSLDLCESKSKSSLDLAHSHKSKTNSADSHNSNPKSKQDSHKSKQNLALFYALLSPNSLLAIPRYIDANTLNEKFYKELLYILGLQQIETNNKVLIKPDSTPNALLDLVQSTFADKLPSDLDEAFETHIFPLLMLWNNRILFLRLLESMLLNFKHIEKPFLHIEVLSDFSALSTLFFKVLAVKERESIPQNLSQIPYLNSSLFEKSALESQGFEIALLESKPLKIAPDSILRRDSAQNAIYKSINELPFLEYLFAFLHAYNFTTTPKDIVDFAKTNHDKLINSAVLGLVFEKLNGYKEGSFFTPSFITRYMCAQSIRKIVVQKFNEANPKWQCETIADIEYEIHREIRTARNTTLCHTEHSEVSQSKAQNRDISVSAKPQYDKDIDSPSPNNIVEEGALAWVDSHNDATNCHTEGEARSISKDNKEIFRSAQNDKNTTSAILAKHNRTFLSIHICDPAVGSGHFLVSALNELIAIKHELGLLLDTQGKRLRDIDLSLENDELIIKDFSGKIIDYTIPAHEHIESHIIQKALFHTKKELIENCLFGVDINPSSVEICKLRLWIELLKYSYYENLATRELQTLPNIDINIKRGNSLISRFALQDSLRHIPNIAQKICEYQNLVFEYKNSDKSELKPQKKDIESKIQNLKATFRLTLKDPKTKKELEKAIQNHIRDFGNFLLDDESLLDGLNGRMGNLFAETSLSEEEQAKAAQSYANIKLLRHRLDSVLSGAEYKHAFEWRFEFPEVLDSNGDFMGFDLIIGNPPYIRQEEIKELKPHLQKAFSIFTSTADIFTYFYEQGLKLLKARGILSLITSNKFCRAGYGANLREFLIQNEILEFVDLNGIKVFDKATVDTCIVNLRKIKPTKSHTINYVDSRQIRKANEIQSDSATESKKQKREISLLNLTYTQIAQDLLNSKAFIFADSRTRNLKAKIEKIGTPLKEWDIEIYRGVLTGYNEAFIIDTATKDSILDSCESSAERKRTEQIIKPILRGRDIKRYSYEWAGLWLINTHNGYTTQSGDKIPPIKIAKYPALKAHFDRQIKDTKKKGKGLFERDDKGITPYNLRNCAYLEDFGKLKISWQRVTQEPSFIIEKDFYLLDSMAFLISNSKQELYYLLGLLNSKAVFWYFRQIGHLYGDNGFLLSNQYVARFPIPKITTKNKPLVDKIIACVDTILTIKNPCHTERSEVSQKIDNRDISAFSKPQYDKKIKDLESKIDSLVYKLYDLDSQEIEIIES